MDILEVFEAGSWGELAARALVPVSVVLFILVVTTVALRLGRAAIRRSAERVRDGEPGWLQKLEGRDDNVPTDDPILRVRRERRAIALASLASSTLTAVVWTISVMMILDQLGIALAPIIASAGIVGVALGFGAQDLVKDFLSGVFILAEDQYGVGDVVDVGEASGVIEGLTLRSTRLRDVNGTLWHVPNGEIRRVGNQSQGWARSLLDIEVAYDSDITVVTDLILEAALVMSNEADWVSLFLEPPEMWGVERVDPDGVVLRLVTKVVPGEQFRVSRELRRRIKATLDASGIDTPLAQRTLWIRTTSDGDEASAPLT